MVWLFIVAQNDEWEGARDADITSHHIRLY